MAIATESMNWRAAELDEVGMICVSTGRYLIMLSDWVKPLLK